MLHITVSLILVKLAGCLGPLPDASQEGLLWPWKGFASVALFQFHVPEESTRATFEFASFQDKQDCPQRQVHVWLQHGSYPVVNASSTVEFPPDKYFLKRSDIEWLTLKSAFKPSETLVHPVYAPEPGSWFAAAYLEPTNEPQGFLRQQCRYSLGSIALWNRADNVELIQPNKQESFITSRHFSYFKFYVPQDTNHFTLTVANCSVLLKTGRALANNESCVQYIGMRAKALPLHQPTEFDQVWKNLSVNSTAFFQENRPYESTYYYLIVVTHGRVKFNINLKMFHCGDSGIYGPVQRKWYLNERGLVWDSSDSDQDRRPKEPTSGFQLFSSNSRIDPRSDEDDYDLDVKNASTTILVPSGSQCISKFDLTRIDNVRAFSAIYMVQGKSWYTKWLTVLEEVPIFTRFETFDFTDLGGSLNIRVRIDTDLIIHSSQTEGYYHQVIGCLSHGRQPRLIANTTLLACDNHSSTLQVSNLDSSTNVEALKVVPFPPPGHYYLGFQLKCRNVTNLKKIPCPASSVSTMISVDVNIQPCDHQPIRDSCGGSGHGICTTNHKGPWSFSACSCAPGYTGWTCERADTQASHSYANTLLLTLSNLFFIPAIVLSFYARSYAQCLVYFSTMVFSIFYHACDQESLTGTLPTALQKTCLSFYVNNEVLQFCDFFSAILSFWVTIVSLSSFPPEVTNAFNLFGAFLVAFLVQYNRTGRLVLLIPVPLGLFIVFLSTMVRILKRKRCFYPNRQAILVGVPAFLCLALALVLATLIGTDRNYPYVHSGWHLLISLSLAFVVLRCGGGRQKRSKVDILNRNLEDQDNEVSVVDMPPSTESSQENNENSIMKRLSYLQKFSALIARQHET